MKDYERLKMLEYPKGIIDVVIDTDAATEVDDPFAIALALLSPERFCIKGIYAAPFAMNEKTSDPAMGMEMSYQEIWKIIQLSKVKFSSVYRGATRFGLGAKSEATEHLASLCMKYNKERPLYVIVLGASTNIANAIISYPEIKEKMVIIWLAGDDFCSSPNVYNIYQDIYSARILFDSGVPLIHVPCNSVTSHLITSIPELESCIENKNELCNYLVQIVRDYSNHSLGWGKQIWDIGPVAFLLNEEYGECEITTSPVITDDLTWSRDYHRHLIKNVKVIQRDKIFGELFFKLASVK